MQEGTGSVLEQLSNFLQDDDTTLEQNGNVMQDSNMMIENSETVMHYQGHFPLKQNLGGLQDVKDTDLIFKNPEEIAEESNFAVGQLRNVMHRNHLMAKQSHDVVQKNNFITKEHSICKENNSINERPVQILHLKESRVEECRINALLMEKSSTEKSCDVTEGGHPIPTEVNNLVHDGNRPVEEFQSALLQTDSITKRQAVVVKENHLQMKKPNDRPIIGILSQKIPKSFHLEHIDASSYIAASYVKYIESAGARVVPIFTDNDLEVEMLFYSLNGLLIPGGADKFFTSVYHKNAVRFYQMAMKANDEGDYFPIWGTCLGFEALHIITANFNMLSSSDSIDISWPLQFTEEAYTSRLFKAASETLMNSLAKYGITYNYHCKCITPNDYEELPALKRFYKILSMNNDKQGKTFISTVEGKQTHLTQHLHCILW